jgi:hypothetical protein
MSSFLAIKLDISGGENQKYHERLVQEVIPAERIAMLRRASHDVGEECGQCLGLLAIRLGMAVSAV